MAKLLYIQASPRGERSASMAVAKSFVDAYSKSHKADEIVTLDLFRTNLPSFEGDMLDAKYAVLHGKDATPEQKGAWKTVEEIIAEFKSPDKYVMAVPMWNFSIPYRLKQYIDIIVQPGYTFSYDPEKGYTGLMTGKRAFIVYARGGEYSSPETQSLDLQTRYVELILGFMGLTDVSSIVVQPTLTADPEVGQHKVETACAEAAQMAAKF